MDMPCLLCPRYEGHAGERRLGIYGPEASLLKFLPMIRHAKLLVEDLVSKIWMKNGNFIRAKLSNSEYTILNTYTFLWESCKTEFIRIPVFIEQNRSSTTCIWNVCV